MALNIENTSGSQLDINDLGISLAIGQIVDLSLIGDPFGVANSANGGDLDSLITAPSVVVKDPIDGTTNLSVADGLEACRAMNETHWRVGTGARVGDISDVAITAAADGQVLRFNSSSGDWENASVASLGAGLLGLGEWEYDNTAGGTPDDKTFRFDNASPPSATEIRIDYNNDAGDDMTNFLQALGPGGFIYAQEDTDSTHGFVLVVDDAGTDNGTFITFPIRDFQSLGTAIADGEKYVFVVGGVGGVSWEAIATDSGTVTPSTDSDTLNLLGGTGIDTSGVDATDTVTITLNAVIDDLTDVDTTTTAPIDADVLTWVNANSMWEPMALTTLLSQQLPSVQARRTTTFAVPVSFAAIDFDTTDIENNSAEIEHLNPGTSSTIEVKNDGLYYIAAILYTTGGVNTYDARIRINGSTTLPGGEHGGNVPITFWAIGDLSAGDDITIEVEQNGGAVTIEANATFVVYALNGVRGEKGDTGSGSSITIEDEGIVVGGGPHDTLDFVGSGVTATDAGGGTATITITGGGDVTAAANIVDNSIVRGDGGVKGIQDSEVGTTSWTIGDDGQLNGAGDVSGDYIAVIMNVNATSGDGLHIMAGEALGDLAMRIGDSDDSFTIMEVEADQGFVVFGETYAQTLINNGVVYGIDNQNSGVSSDINMQNGVYRVAGTPVTVGEEVIQRFTFPACSMENPINADWAVNALAPATPDTNNAGIIVRRFDDTTDEGVGFSVRIPPEATDMTIEFVSRAETAPGGAVTAALDLYRRDFPDDAAPSAWSGALALTAIDLPTNENWQYDSQTITLATLGLTAGEEVQFELVRNGGTLSGDWTLKSITVTFSEES